MGCIGAREPNSHRVYRVYTLVRYTSAQSSKQKELEMVDTPAETSREGSLHISYDVCAHLGPLKTIYGA